MLQNVHYFDQISNVRYANKVCFFRTYKSTLFFAYNFLSPKPAKTYVIFTPPAPCARRQNAWKPSNFNGLVTLPQPRSDLAAALKTYIILAKFKRLFFE